MADDRRPRTPSRNSYLTFWRLHRNAARNTARPMKMSGIKKC